jgi:hypothetical protein
MKRKGLLEFERSFSSSLSKREGGDEFYDRQSTDLTLSSYDKKYNINPLYKNQGNFQSTPELNESSGVDQ